MALLWAASDAAATRIKNDVMGRGDGEGSIQLELLAPVSIPYQWLLFVLIQDAILKDEHVHFGSHKAAVGILRRTHNRLTKLLREKGSMLGKIETNGHSVQFSDPNQENLVGLVSVPKPVVYQGGKHRVVLVDCGCKNGILRSLLARGVTVVRVPWNYDFLGEDVDGIVVSNGPGDPKMCVKTVEHLRGAMDTNRPIFGICLGNQLLALAAGADTFKLKFGHRSHNQPCVEVGTRRCYITSQNHGYAVRSETLPEGWQPWFVNANDGTNEGIRHRSRPFMSVQFHPEATPGPEDTGHLFDEFLSLL